MQLLDVGLRRPRQVAGGKQSVKRLTLEPERVREHCKAPLEVIRYVHSAQTDTSLICVMNTGT